MLTLFLLAIAQGFVLGMLQLTMRTYGAFV
jgi:hypothetical protein